MAHEEGHRVPVEAPVGPQEVVALEVARRLDNTYVQVQAIAALGDLGPEAAEAVAALRTLAQDSQPQIRNAAAESLRKLERKK